MVDPMFQLPILACGTVGGVGFGLGIHRRPAPTILAAAAAMATAGVLASTWPALGLALAGGIAGLLAGQGLLTATARASVALATAIGMVAAGMLPALVPSMGLPILDGLLGILTHLIAGLLVSFGVLPAHVPGGDDPVLAARDRIAARVSGARAKRQLDEAHTLYLSLDDALGDGEAFASDEQYRTFRDAIIALVMKLLGLTSRNAALEALLAEHDEESLRRRIEEAHQKAQEADDETVALQQRRLEELLQKRLDTLAEVSRAGQRARASLELTTATLEDMYVSLKRLSVSGGAGSGDLESLSQRVRDLTDDVETTARSLEELDQLGVAPETNGRRYLEA